MGLSINEAMKLAGDRNAWRSTVLNLGCHAVRRDFVIVVEALRQSVSQSVNSLIKDAINDVMPVDAFKASLAT